MSRKGKISIKNLEKDYKKNREYVDRLTRLKTDDKNRTVLSNALVYEGGRYRVPGTKYTSKKDLKGRTLRASSSRSKRDSRSKNSSRVSSRAGSRRGSRAKLRPIGVKTTKNITSKTTNNFFTLQRVDSLNKSSTKFRPKKK